MVFRYTKEHIKEKFIPLWNKYGPFSRWQVCELYKTYNIPSGPSIKFSFGSLENFAKEMNIKFIIPDRMRNVRISKESILIVMNKIFKEHPVMSHVDIKKLCSKKVIPFSYDVIRSNFGSLDNLASECNYKFSKPDRAKNRRIEKQVIILDIKKLLNKYPNLSKMEFYKKMDEELSYSCQQVKKIGINNISKILNYQFRQTTGFNNKGKNEDKILDIIEKNKDIKLQRQKYVDGYFVDGYDEKNNVVYEIDEVHHKFRKLYDKLREERIKQLMGCVFMRINEREFLKTLQLQGD